MDASRTYLKVCTSTEDVGNCTANNNAACCALQLHHIDGLPEFAKQLPPCSTSA